MTSRAGMAMLALFLIACAGSSDHMPEQVVAHAAFGEETLEIHVDYGRDELVLEMPAVDLPSAGGAADGHDHAGVEPPPQYGTIPVSGWLHGYSVELVDGAGRVVPRELIHHVNIIAPGRRELFSPIMQRIGAVGSETAPVKLPRMIGYPIRRGDRILLTGMLHNPTPESYAGVRIRVRMPLTGVRRVLPPLRVYPFYLDVMPPASVHRFDLPPGRSAMSWEGRPAMSGRVLGMGGHLHRYAVTLRLEDVTGNEVIWETRPVVDADGAVVGMPQEMLWRKLGIPVHADRLYRLTAVYENPTGDTIHDGGMGALGGIMLPGRGEPWPAVDARNPEYLLDIQLTRRGGRTGAPAGTRELPRADATLRDADSPAPSHTH